MRKILLIGIAVVFIVASFLHQTSAFTQDLGRHLLTGEIILSTHAVPHINLFSYTFPNFPFINHHWFSEVIFYITNGLAGASGLLILSTTVVAAAMTVSVMLSLKRSASFVGIFISLILYIHILIERTDIRPEIFSFLFLSLFILILYFYKNKFTKLIFFLPLFQLIWTNTHIYFPIGIATIGLFFVDLLLEEKKLTKKTKYLFIILIVCILSTLINPNGLHGALYPFTVFNNYGYSIEENQDIFFLWNYSQKQTIAYFALTFFLLAASFGFSWKKIKRIDVLITIFFTYLALTAIRNFPLFVFGTFSIFALYFSHAIEKSIRVIQKKTHGYFLYKYIFIVTIAIITTWQVIQLSSYHGFGFGEYTGAKPGVDFLITNNINGAIFNNFDIGSYLEYRLYPKQKVFIDGRPEAYPARFIQETYIPMQEQEKVFEDVDKKYNFNTIFFSHTDQTPWANMFFSWISKSDKWHTVYMDDFTIILLKKNEKNKNLLSKYSTPVLSYNNNDIQSLLRTAYAFAKIGNTKKAEELYDKAVELNKKKGQ